MTDSKMTSKDVSELYAAYTLVLTVPGYPHNLIHEDFPDWITSDKDGNPDGELGLEVTYAMDKADKDYSSEKISKIKTLGDALDMRFDFNSEMHFRDEVTGIYFAYNPKDRTIRQWKIPHEYCKFNIDELNEDKKDKIRGLTYIGLCHEAENSISNEFFDNPYRAYSEARICLKDKLPKLQKYKETKHTHLFIIFPGFVSDITNVILDFMEEFENIQSEYERRFDKVYLSGVNGLVEFDFDKNKAFFYEPYAGMINEAVRRVYDEMNRLNVSWPLKMFDDMKRVSICCQVQRRNEPVPASLELMSGLLHSSTHR